MIRDCAFNAGVKSTRNSKKRKFSDTGISDDDKNGNKKKRGNYRCSKCGQLKKGHYCKTLEMLNKEFKDNWDSLLSEKSSENRTPENQSPGSVDLSLEEENVLNEDDHYGNENSYSGLNSPMSDNSSDYLVIQEVSKNEKSNPTSEQSLSPFQSYEYNLLPVNQSKLCKGNQYPNQYYYDPSLGNIDFKRIAQPRVEYISMSPCSLSDFGNQRINTYCPDDLKLYDYDCVLDLNQRVNTYCRDDSEYMYYCEANQYLEPDHIVPIRPSYNKDMYRRDWNESDVYYHHDYMNSGYSYIHY